MAERHPLAGRPELTVAEVLDEPFPGPQGAATPLVAELAEMARRMHQPDAPGTRVAPA
jgi:hypothetical protein